MKILKNKKSEMLVAIFTFLFFINFYVSYHPIIISDADDWLYTFYHRSPFPSWGDWNPTRILAEILMPTVTLVSAKLFMPFTNNYIEALAIGYAVLMSVIMTIFVWMVYKFFMTYKSSNKSVIALSFIFIISHFWIFRTKESDNVYMLWTVDTCAYFYYLIPNILNSILVLWFSMDDDISKLFWKKEKYFKKSIFVAILYLCMFSNIWASVIIMAYVGALLLTNLIKGICAETLRLLDYVKKNSLYLIVFVVWVIVQIFELSGGRAESTDSDSIVTVIEKFVAVLVNINLKYALMFFSILVLGVITIIKEKSKDIAALVICVVSMVLEFLYTVITCTKTGAEYIERPAVFYGLFFYGMILFGICFMHIINKMPGIKLIVPLIIVIAIVDCNTADITYKDSNNRGWNSDIAREVANDVINQVKDAEKQSLDCVDVYIPIFDSESEDNWPYSTTSAYNISESLYKNGIIKYKIEIRELIPTEEKNKELHVGK